MMPQLLKPPFAAGLASAIIFVLLSMLNFNGLFLIFSAIPLLYIGYSLPFAPVLISGATASFILLLFNPTSSLFYITVIAVPCFFVLAHRMRGHTLTPAIVDICGYAIVLVSLIQISTLDQGGIQGMLSEAFDLSNTEEIDPRLVEQLDWLSGSGSYLLIGMMVWWSVIFLLMAIWTLEKIIDNSKHKQLLGKIMHFDGKKLPSWLLGGLLLSILMGFLASENIRFLGLLGFVIMLLPYFFVGVMNTPLKKALESGLGWSLVVSILMMILAWPAIIMATLGVFNHAKQLIIKD